MKDGTPNALTFGIYPGSAVGDTGPAGPPDRPDQINQALSQLQGSPGRPFIVRAYEAHADQGDTAHPAILQTPADYARYLGSGRTLDLVAQYHSRSGDIDGYCAFIEKLIDRHGEHIATLQIGEEPNITGYIHHTLRDAYSAGSGLFCRFGLMTDDYTPKPAFHAYRDLIDAPGTQQTVSYG